MLAYESNQVNIYSFNRLIQFNNRLEMKLGFDCVLVMFLDKRQLSSIKYFVAGQTRQPAPPQLCFKVGSNCQTPGACQRGR